MRPRLSYANVLATIAVFIALGGTSYAVTVTGDDVPNGSLTGKDIAKNSLQDADINGLGGDVLIRAGTPATGSPAAVGVAECNTGEELVSGGYGLGGPGPTLPTVLFNQPRGNPGQSPNAWEVVAAHPGSTVTVYPFALCVK